LSGAGGDASVETEVRRAIDALFQHLANNRLDEACAAFATDESTALYGSEADEVVVGPDKIRAFPTKLLARPGPVFTLESVALSWNGDVAWFTSGAVVQVSSSGARLPYRLTGVLVRREGKWLWALFNGSEPLPPRAPGGVT
jgi:ketosteroid isomerase-like protein